MFEFHSDKNIYFQYQYLTSKEFIIPFIDGVIDLSSPKRILEIGCAEAGVLKAFTESGHQCVGIELQPSRVRLAEQFMAEELAAGQVRFLAKDIYDIRLNEDIGYQFDIIILKDVIEHIHNQEVFMRKLKDFLTEEGVIFFGFPPWMMPFGGHQQISNVKLLSIMPYYHLLPMKIYRGILKLFGEQEKRIEDLIEIKQTGISIERFDKILRQEEYQLIKKQLFLTNPIYKYKFNLKVRKQNRLVGSIPFFRNFVSTCVYYLIRKA